MTGVEILLLVIGVVFFVASFFITEKLGPGELSKIGELSHNEIHQVMEREVRKVSRDIEEKVKIQADEVLIRSERSMERECNEKIMAISEYSDTVIESMNKTHTEIMFLYSMLNDKHAELTDLSSRLQELAHDLQKKDEEIAAHMVQRALEQELEKEQAVMAAEHTEENILPVDTSGKPEDSNHKSEILALYKEGKPGIDIARELGVGLAEVQLVIGLYEGKRKR